VGDEVEQRTRLVSFLPRPAAVAADHEPLVRHIEAVDAASNGAQDVEVGFPEQRDRLPRLPRVGGFDQAEQPG
jgi:hypothetical protein